MSDTEEEFDGFCWSPQVTAVVFFVADGDSPDEEIAGAMNLGLVLKRVVSGRQFVFGRPEANEGVAS